MTEPQQFQYDVFLNHSSKDKPIVRDLAHLTPHPKGTFITPLRTAVLGYS